MATRFVEFATLLVAAALGVLTLDPVVSGGEDTLFKKEISATQSRMKSSTGKSHLVVLSFHRGPVVIPET